MRITFNGMLFRHNGSDKKSLSPVGREQVRGENPLIPDLA
jgi:hypothetical protein